MERNHQWISEGESKWGGYLFKCVQCGKHTIESGITEQDAFRSLLRGLSTHFCEDADIAILTQFRARYGNLLEDMIL